MSTSSHAIFIVVFGSVYFVVVIFNIFGEKCDFLQVVKIPYPENRLLGNLWSFFSRYKFFPEWAWLFPVSKLKKKYSDKKMSSLAGLKKRYLISRKSTDSGHFWLPRSTFKVDFLNVPAKIQKILGKFVRGGC